MPEANGTYILSLDLGEKLEAFRRIGIDAPGPHDDYTTDLQKELTNIVGEALPDVEVQPIFMSDLADEVIGKASRLMKMLGHPLVVSSCPEIAYPAGGKEIEINRLINLEGEMLGLGPRPGHPSVEEQIRRIKPAANRRVVIVEDGVFTGGTVRHLIGQFKDQGIEVAAVVAGFNCGQTDNSWAEGNGYDLYTTETFERIVDWVPDHDFLPFVPGCGKVVGTELNGNTYPFYDYRHATYSVPYIRPFGPIESWASIPEERAQKVSGMCIGLALDLFRTIDAKNPEPVCIGDLIATRQRTSIPASIGNGHFPPLDCRVTTYLAETM